MKDYIVGLIHLLRNLRRNLNNIHIHNCINTVPDTDKAIKQDSLCFKLYTRIYDATFHEVLSATLQFESTKIFPSRCDYNINWIVFIFGATYLPN